MCKNFWYLRVHDRLQQWRLLRTQLAEMPMAQAAQHTAELWATAPFVQYYLDPAAPQTWPNPWELLADNYYCDVALSLGMLYTLYLSGHIQHGASIAMYADPKQHTRHSLVCLDQGKYILNYYPREVVNNKQVEVAGLHLLCEYTSSDLALDKY
jgi:hypothetical protein